MKIDDFRKIVFQIAKAAQKRETILIYYPKTDNSCAGFREIEPYSLATDIGKMGEHLVYGEDLISSGHILNAYTVGSKANHCGSFILGKITQIKPTGKKFIPRDNWQVEF